MTDRLRMLVSGRAVIPGTRHALVTEHEDLGVGERVVVVFDRGDGSIGRIGTAATIRAIDRRDLGLVVDVVGESLVTVARDTWEIAPLEPGPRPPQALLLEAQAALRSYMAARAEAGMGGDVHVELAPDPVTASHQVASHLEISWPEVQDILEAGDAAERLRREIQVLRRETSLLRVVLGRSR